MMKLESKPHFELKPQFEVPVSLKVWDKKYRYRYCDFCAEISIFDSWRRVAVSCAQPEREVRYWQHEFYRILHDFQFLPSGRILAGASTHGQVTMCSGFVSQGIADSIDSVFERLKESAIIIQHGGGVGVDLSALRPSSMPIKSAEASATGPVGVMPLWNQLCDSVVTQGERRRSVLLSLRCNHPDIEQFINAKRQSGALANVRLAVLVTDEFMRAVRADDNWTLSWPEYSPSIVKVVSAVELWDKIMEAAFTTSEPAVLFIDSINENNNLGYYERLSTTAPAGGVPLPNGGACSMGSINLTRFVLLPFMMQSRFDWAKLIRVTAAAVRMLDNCVDLCSYPLPAHRTKALESRRLGLGITGLADMLQMLNIQYESSAARQLTAQIVCCMRNVAYKWSTVLAREKGVFPAFDKDSYLSSPFVSSLSEPVKLAIARYGIRNSHLLSIAPAESISLLANNVSNGIEPIYRRKYLRRIEYFNEASDGYALTPYADRLWRKLYPDAPLPEAFSDRIAVGIRAHMTMQASLQPYVDNAIAKTIPANGQCTFDEFKKVYAFAYQMELKGVTIERVLN